MNENIPGKIPSQGLVLSSGQLREIWLGQPLSHEKCFYCESTNTHGPGGEKSICWKCFLRFVRDHEDDPAYRPALLQMKAIIDSGIDPRTMKQRRDQ